MACFRNQLTVGYRVSAIMFALHIGSGCQTSADQSSEKSGAMQVTVAQKANITTNGRQESIEAGKEFLASSSVLITSDGYFPMTLVPVKLSGSRVEIKLEPIPTPDAGVDPQVEVNQLFSEILKAQRHIGAGSGAAALSVVEAAQAKWPGVVLLDYLKASALVINQDYQRAAAVVNSGLAKDPTSQELIELKAFISNQ